MNSNDDIYPIRRKFFSAFILGITVICIFGCMMAAVMLFSLSKASIEKQSRQWANVMGQSSVTAIEEGDKKLAVRELELLQSVSFVDYVHIYSYQPDKSLDFFASYNRRHGAEKLPAIPDRRKEIESLLIGKFYDNFYEVVIPIKKQSQLQGYVYLRANLAEEYRSTKRSISFIVFITIIVITGALFAFVYLQKAITQPLQQLVDFVQVISQKRDYSMRCPPMPYQELDILGSNINRLLGRTEKQFERQAQAEQQILQLNQELEDKVSQRTDALKESNQELLSTLEKLHQYQGQLVESEKMASLGDMVAGVAHEVNTPIGLGVTASSLLSDRLDEIAQAYESKTLKSSQLKKFLADGTENVGIISRNLERAADLISSFKKLAVDQSSEDFRQFNVAELINEVIMTLRPELKDNQYDIKVNCPNNLLIKSKPGPLNQVLVNLIMNSIIHGFESSGQGQITITVMVLSSQLHINYADNGVGVDKSIKGKIFEPFTTTKRGAGGSGLGLHLVYNLVTQALGGTINLESEPGEGVRFDIDFPFEA